MSKFFRRITVFLAVLMLFVSVPVFAEETTTKTNTKSSGEFSNTSKNDFVIAAKETTLAGDESRKYIDIDIKKLLEDDVFKKGDLKIYQDYDVENLVASVSIENPKSVFINGSSEYELDGRPTYNSIRVYVDTMETDEDVSVPIKVDLRYDVTIKTYEYEKNSDGTENKDKIINPEITRETRNQSSTIYVIHKATEIAKNSSIEIMGVEVFPNGKVVPGEDFYLKFRIENTGDAPAKNIKLQLDGLDANGISMKDDLNTRDITYLDNGQRTEITFHLTAPNALLGGRYPLKLKYSFPGVNRKDKETNAQKESEYQFTVDVAQASMNPSVLIFDKIDFPQGRLGKNQKSQSRFFA